MSSAHPVHERASTAASTGSRQPAYAYYKVTRQHTCTAVTAKEHEVLSATPRESITYSFCGDLFLFY